MTDGCQGVQVETPTRCWGSTAGTQPLQPINSIQAKARVISHAAHPLQPGVPGEQLAQGETARPALVLRPPGESRQQSAGPVTLHLAEAQGPLRLVPPMLVTEVLSVASRSVPSQVLVPRTRWALCRAYMGLEAGR